MSQQPDLKGVENISIISVEVFFVLSGFVLAPQIIFCMRKNQAANLKVFFLRRWIRTLPPFIFALIGISAISANLFTGEFFKYLFFVRNVFSISNIGDYYAPAWSLAVEEWFYIVFPVFLLLTKKRRLSILAQTLLFVAILLLIKLVVAAVGGNAMMHARRVVLFRIDSIAFGFLLYFIFEDVSVGGYSWLRMGAPAIFLGSAVALFQILNSTSSGHSAVLELAFFYIAPLLGMSLILTACSLEKSLVKSTIIKGAADFFGKISYTVYLFHVAFITLISRRLSHESGMVRFTVFLAALLIFCYLFHIYVEAPLLSARPRYRKEMDSKGPALPSLA